MLGLSCDGWGPSLAIGSGNCSKLVRLAEVFAPHKIPIHRAEDIQANARVQLSVGCSVFAGLSRLQRDCVYKTLCFPVGAVACVAGLSRASADRESCKDQAFFVDTTPQGSSVFMRDHHCAYSDLTMFHPSISLEEFTGEQVRGARVLLRLLVGSLVGAYFVENPDIVHGLIGSYCALTGSYCALTDGLQYFSCLLVESIT